jgi:asparagine synthase (glutamine-hydrolysing)
VALNGDGGDEAFAGYTRYLPHLVYRHADRLPLALRRALVSAAALARPLARRFRLARRASGVLSRTTLPPLERYARTIVYFDEDQKRGLYAPDFARTVASSDPLSHMRLAFESAGAPTLLDRLLATDLETYLPDTLLVKMDIACMANSLEARSPFLDHVLVEFAARVPAGLKIRGFTPKYILRRAGEGILPPPILKRGKQGFAIPLDRWFREKLKPYAAEALLAPRALARGYFREEAVRRILQDHWNGLADHGPRIWALLVFELWHRIFVDHETL